MSDESPLPILEEAPVDARPPRRRRPLLIVLASVLVLTLAGLGIGAYYTGTVFNALQQIERDDDMMPVESDAVGPDGGLAPDPDAEPGVDPSAEPGAEDGADDGEVPTSDAPLAVDNGSVNIVLMGSDTRGNERGRSDVLQLIHIPSNRSAVYLLSFPRDSWVDIPGRGKGKINWAYSYGGAKLTIDTLQRMVGVKMNHAAIIDFEGFSRVIDALGGVTVYNRHSTASRGYTFPKGNINLDGAAALVFVRERYTIPGGDFGRAERQRDVIKAIAKKLASAGVLANPAKFGEVVSRIGSQFTVDSGLTNEAIVSLGLESTSAFSNVRSLGMPNLGTGRAGTQSIVRVDWSAMEELKKALRTDTVDAFYTKYGG